MMGAGEQITTSYRTLDSSSTAHHKRPRSAAEALAPLGTVAESLFKGAIAHQVENNKWGSTAADSSSEGSKREGLLHGDTKTLKPLEASAAWFAALRSWRGTTSVEQDAEDGGLDMYVAMDEDCENCCLPPAEEARLKVVPFLSKIWRSRSRL